MEEGESDASAVQREVRHRLGVDVQAGKLMSYVSHPYAHYVVELYLYEGKLLDGQPSAVNVGDFRWVKSEDFEAYTFTPADEASMTKLLGL